MKIRSSACLSAGLGFIALSLAGCVGVDRGLVRQDLPAPPAQWVADANVSGVPTGDWVGAFGDPALPALIKEALDHNRSLATAVANVQAARASAQAAFGGLLPTLNANPRATRQAIVTDPTVRAQTGGSGALQSRRVYINNYSLGAQASWEIDLWGRLADTARAAHFDLAAARADLEGMRLSVSGAVAQSWFQLIEARLQRELSERDVAARQRNVDLIAKRFKAGVAAELDLKLAQSALAQSAAGLADNRRIEDQSRRQLEVLLGRYPAAELEAAAALPRLANLSGAGAPGDLLARRPDLIAAEARMEAAGLRAREARKELLPRLTLSSAISASGPNLSDVASADRLAGNIAAGLATPLFQGGQLRANSRRARAVATARVHDYAQAALEAYQDAEDALAAESLLAERESQLKIAFEAAEAAENITQKRYEAGAASIFDLLNAETRRITAEQAYVFAQRQRLANRVQVYLAIGGDYAAKTSAVAAAEAAPSASR